MAKTNPSIILLKGDPIYKEYPLAPLDACGNGAITPGMLVETVSGEVRPHSTLGGDASPLFAVEGLNEDSASKTMGDIDVDYDDDNGAVKTAFCKPGDEIYALIVAGANISIDGLLQSSSDGYLMAYTATTLLQRRSVCRALEAVNNSAGSAPARIKVEVL